MTEHVRYRPMQRRLMVSVGMLMVACASLWVDGGLAAQDPMLTPLVQGEVSTAAPRTYSVAVRAGDVIQGTVNLVTGGPIAVEVIDSSGLVLATFDREEAGESTVGFLSQASTTLRLRVSAKSSQKSSFVLRIKVESPAVRMANVHVEPTSRYQSGRIQRLAAEVQTGKMEALAAFWAEAAAGGGPLVEPLAPPQTGRGGRGGGRRGQASDDDALVTFLWRQTFETYNVALIRPPESSVVYYLTRLPGTDVWYHTMRVHRSSRFLYSFSPNHRSEDGPFEQIDPLNSRWWPEGSDRLGAWRSVLELDRAPDESWIRRQPSQRGALRTMTFDSTSLKARLDMHLYTPPGYSASSGPYPLVILFDGSTYALGPIAAPTTLDNLISASRIRPPVVCFINSATSTGNRAANLSFNSDFNSAVATEVVPWLRNQFSISNERRDVVVGGYSAGARAAADLALSYPGVFGTVLLQSGALRARELQKRYIETPRAPIRFYIDIGLYENVPSALLSLDESALDYGLTMANRHFRDILLAKGYEVTYRETGGAHHVLHWRATFAEALIGLLAPAK